MSDQTIVTLMGMVIGFFTLWLQLKYKVEKKVDDVSFKADAAAAEAGKAAQRAQVVEDKLDDNTAITARIEQQTNGTFDGKFNDHAARIMTLESKVETLSKNIDSTRHEIRGHLQMIMNKLDLAAALAKSKEPPEKPC